MTCSQAYAELMAGPKYVGQIDREAGLHLIELGLAQTYQTSKGEWRIAAMNPPIQGPSRSSKPYSLGLYKTRTMGEAGNRWDSEIYKKALRRHE